MATIPALGARNLPANYTPVAPRADGKPANTPATQQAGAASSLSKLSSNALDMQQRVASLGNATVDFAQNFVNSFTQALFGDDAALLLFCVAGVPVDLPSLRGVAAV